MSKWPLTERDEIVAYLRGKHESCDCIGCRECETYENAAKLIERLTVTLRQAIPFMHHDCGSMTPNGWRASTLREQMRELTKQSSSDGRPNG